MLECIKMWEGLEKELNADIGFVSGGNLLYVDNETDMKEIERGARLAKEHGVDSYIISPRGDPRAGAGPDGSGDRSALLTL